MQAYKQGSLAMRKLTVSLCIGLLFVFPVLSLASGIDIPGVGDKATSMGGAFRALANDWSAAWWNPAGLAYLESSQFTSQLMILSPRPEFTPDIAADNLGQIALGYRNGMEWVPSDRHFYYPNAAGFYKLPNTNNLNAGVAVLFPYGMGSRWDLFDPLPGYNEFDTVGLFPGTDHEVNFVVVDIHPTVAKELVEDKLSAGVGLSIQNGDLAYQRTYFISSSSVVPGGAARPYENFLMDSKIQADGWGIGVNLGILFKASPKLNLAASYRSPVNINLSGHVNQGVYFPYNSELVKADSSLAPFFTGGAAFNKPSLDMTLKLPGQLGIGLALFASESFTLTADWAWTQWSRFDQWELEFESGSVTPGLGTMPPSQVVLEWDDVSSFSIGMEYVVREDLTVRAGYANDPSPIPDETISPMFLDFSDKNRLNLGGSYSWQEQKYEVGYNFEYINFKDREVSTLMDVDGDGNFDNFPGSYTTTVYGSHFYFTYRF
jgi:long-chain fatty acid transport protein